MEEGRDDKRDLAELLLGEPEIVAWLGYSRPMPEEGEDEPPESERY